MKKLTSLLLIILLLVFAACSTTEAGRIDRWNDEIDIKFNIRLLTGKLNEDGSVNTDESEEGFFVYSKNPGTQVKPDWAGGEYSYTVKHVNNKWELTQSTTLNEKFYKANFDLFQSDDWKEKVPSTVYTEDKDDENDADTAYVLFTTTVTSAVTFKTFNKNGGAEKSEKAVKGVFVNIAEEDSSTEHEIWYNDYTVKVDYSGETAATTFTDRAENWDLPSSQSVKVTENVFDNEMFIFAVRALNFKNIVDKSETFPSYNGLNQKEQTIVVSVHEENAGTAAALYCVAVGPEGEAYPYLFQFENSTAPEKMVRPVNSLGGKVQGYDLLSFSQGYLKFEKV